MIKIKCDKCGEMISKNNHERHLNSKSCNLKITHRIKLEKCPHCDISLKDINTGNHIRWCDKNPERKSPNSGKPSWNSGMTKDSNQSIKSMSEKIIEKHRNGDYEHVDYSSINIGRKHTEETKIKMSESARKSKHTRKCKSTHRYIDASGREFMFDSSWEDILADRLDELKIYWIRPEPVCWIDYSGKHRNYFSDFYLPDYDLYLDPKNSYCREKQKDKIEIVSKSINLIILKDIQECRNFNPNQYLKI